MARRSRSKGRGRAERHEGRGGGGGRSGLDQLEGRNVVLEALRVNRRRVVEIRLDERAKIAGKLEEILTLASEREVPVIRVPRFELDQSSETGVHNGVLARAHPLPAITTSALLDDLEQRGEVPFIVLVDEVQYEQNLGAILRTALGAGVHAVVVPVRRGKGLTPVVQRVAMGAAEQVPVIREGLLSAMSTLRRRGVRVVGAGLEGAPLWEVSMTGPFALVLGGEAKGLTQTVCRQCEELVHIPMAGPMDSLNVSVSTGILLYEKVRQDRKE